MRHSERCKARLRARHAGRIGAYHPHRFLITFDPSIPFVGADRRRNIKYFHFFAHEYLHFWHNLSTVSGFKLFAFTQHLLAVFSRTLNPSMDGTARGSAVLEPEEIHRSSELIALITDLEGQGWPDESTDPDDDLSFIVTRVMVDHDQDAPLATQRVPNPSAILSVETHRTGEHPLSRELRLGAYAIEEGIAMLVEQSVARFIEDAQCPPVSEFPYRVLERTVEHIVGAPQLDFVAAALGTLALLSTHPGPTLVVLAQQYKNNLTRGMSSDTALEAVIKDTSVVRERDINRCREGAAELVRMQTGRGLSEGAVEYFQEQLDTAMEVRLQDPLIDVRAAFQTENPRRSFIHLMDRFPPCNILQETEGPEDKVMRDRIFGERFTTARGFETSECTRTLHAQQDFLQAHIDAESGEFLASSDARSRCPYFTACDLPLRVANADVCATQPWLSYQQPEQTCWYGVAVAASLGPVQIRKSAKD